VTAEPPRVHRAEGNFLEDFQVGDVYRHPLGRTISEADNTWFTLLTMNTNQLHFNADFAGASPHGRLLVNSGLSVAVVLGISVSDMSQNAIANLGWTDIRLTHPLFVGDTLYAESLVTDVRRSRSRPHAGIVTCITRGLNQDGVEILRFERSVMVWARSGRDLATRFPTATEPLAASPAPRDASA
jgi:itaconyl-CoA hydratase